MNQKRGFGTLFAERACDDVRFDLEDARDAYMRGELEEVSGFVNNALKIARALVAEIEYAQGVIDERIVREDERREETRIAQERVLSAISDARAWSVGADGERFAPDSSQRS